MIRKTLLSAAFILASAAAFGANFPEVIPTTNSLYTAVNECDSVLSGGIGVGDLSLTVSDGACFPDQGYLYIGNEAIKYTSKSGATFSGLSRGSDGTTAAAHSDGATVSHAIVAAHHNVLRDELISMATFFLEGSTLHIDTANARVGIGVANPDEALDVLGNVELSNSPSSVNFLEFSDYIGSYDAYLSQGPYDSAANYIRFKAYTAGGGGDDAGVRINGVMHVGAESVGINDNDPSTTLEVGGGIAAATGTFSTGLYVTGYTTSTYFVGNGSLLTNIGIGSITPGRQELTIEAPYLAPTVANGATAVATVASTSTATNFDAIALSSSTTQYFTMNGSLPISWDGSTVTFQAVWTSTNAAVDGTSVTFCLQGYALGDGESFDRSYGTAVCVEDLWVSSWTAHVSPMSAAITIGGSPTPGDTIVWRGYRNVDAAGDTMAQNALLVRLRLFYTKSSLND